LHNDFQDINDADTLRRAVTDATPVPHFERVTKSAYFSNMQVVRTRVDELAACIRALLPTPHRDARTFLAIPSALDGKDPTILTFRCSEPREAAQSARTFLRH
jgi:hypothetical protein